MNSYSRKNRKKILENIKTPSITMDVDYSDLWHKYSKVILVVLFITAICSFAIGVSCGG